MIARTTLPLGIPSSLDKPNYVLCCPIAHCSNAAQNRYDLEPASSILPLPTFNFIYKKTADISLQIIILVAGTGLEPAASGL